MLESEVESAFVRRLKRELGLTSAKLKAISNAGWPDRMIPLPNGKVVFVEFKAPGKERNLSEHQKVIIATLRGYGIPVLVSSSASEAIDFVIRNMQSGLQTP